MQQASTLHTPHSKRQRALATTRIAARTLDLNRYQSERWMKRRRSLCAQRCLWFTQTHTSSTERRQSIRVSTRLTSCCILSSLTYLVARLLTAYCGGQAISQLCSCEWMPERMNSGYRWKSRSLSFSFSSLLLLSFATLAANDDMACEPSSDGDGGADGKRSESDFHAHTLTYTHTRACSLAPQLILGTWNMELEA